MTVIFSMTGAEVATIAAAESKDPERAVAKAANSVIARIATFYIGSILLLTIILPWNDTTVAASPFVAAFTQMGIPYADDLMNAVVLTAVLSCLNSGMYTASRMLFVLAARREAPLQLVSVTKRGVPAVAILASSVVGFLCVIAAAVSPDTVFAFLLNSSGAIILFVYVLIGISQIVLRRRSGSEHLRVKMWLFPGLSIFTVLGIVAILAQMGIEPDSRSQLVLSLLSWAVVIAFYFANKWFIARRPVPQEMAPALEPRRVLVLANETANSDELLDELRRIGADRAAHYFVAVPASPVETGTAATHGPLDVMEATQDAAQARLDHTLSVLRSENLQADGASGGLPAAAGTGQRRRHLPPGSDRDRHPAARGIRLAPVRRRRPRPRGTPRHAGDPCRGDPGGDAAGLPMTIIAGFSSSRQGSAPLNLATQLARTTGEKIIAAAVVERTLPAGVDPIEDEYRGYLASRATESLQRWSTGCPATSTSP